MKKVLKSVLVVLAIAVMAFALTACEKKEDSKKESKKSEGIVGSWKYEGADYTYTFNEDKTGEYNAAGNKMEFTYELDGNKISILYTGNTAPFETEYEIKGDELNVKDSFGNDTIYKRK